MMIKFCSWNSESSNRNQVSMCDCISKLCVHVLSAFFRDGGPKLYYVTTHNQYAPARRCKHLHAFFSLLAWAQCHQIDIFLTELTQEDRMRYFPKISIDFNDINVGQTARVFSFEEHLCKLSIKSAQRRQETCKRTFHAHAWDFSDNRQPRWLAD